MITGSLIAVCLLALPLIALVAFNGAMARRATALVPPAGRFVTVDGIRLHYVEAGSGPAVLLIHGLSSQLQTFTYGLTPLLQSKFRVIAVDRPGSGYSQAASAATLDAQAALLGGLLDTLGIDRALVVGHSLGGAVALALALDRPEQVVGVALIAPATRPQDEVPDSLRRLAIRSDLLRWILAWTIATPLLMRNRTAILSDLFASDPVPADFAIRGGSVLGLRPASYRNAARDLVEAGGQLATIARRYGLLRQPVGVLFGTGDRILDYRHHGQALGQQIPDFVFETVDAGGHMTPLSSPQRCAAFIEQTAKRAGLLDVAASG